ncbi:DUF4235 domain-containing protein [Schaalia sp. 19OD2882]|uniref:DUF4235 domain-containing protein n=1 Tax=Schaalia sp. 19OD2882 TaxID=2794089 RepID=UPI0020A6FF72|nr:DUF4235 domain-containing protein [Schaalia sp. 19OD2882]
MDIGWKIASTGAVALSALVAGKIVEVAWRGITGTDVPGDDDDTDLIALVAFAAVSAGVVAVAQHYALRRARKWYGPERITAG